MFAQEPALRQAYDTVKQHERLKCAALLSIATNYKLYTINTRLFT